MSPNFYIAHTFVKKWEGGLTEDEGDNGGITKYGVDIAMLSSLSKDKKWQFIFPKLGISLPVTRETIINLTEEQALGVYYYTIWDYLKLDEFPLKIAMFIYDSAVNHGINRAIKFIQQAYSYVYPDTKPLVDDGIMGDKTRKAILTSNSYDIFDKACALREIFYYNIVKRNPSQQKFLKGWLNRLNDLKRSI